MHDLAVPHLQARISCGCERLVDLHVASRLEARTSQSPATTRSLIVSPCMASMSSARLRAFPRIASSLLTLPSAPPRC